MRTFNNAGPCQPDLHYMLPAEERLPECRRLIERRAYFVVHAPRQTGKSTSMIALAQHLRAEGNYAAVYFSCEAARMITDDFAAAERVVWAAIEQAAHLDLPAEWCPPPAVETTPGKLLSGQLVRWAQACPRPLVLIFDEIDSLTGPALSSILSQLREGFYRRPKTFPSSVVLCGMRDVRDYKVASGGGPIRAGSSSPFNIKAQSLRLANFTEAELRALYGQHTADTGQAFAEEALTRAWELTQGQPWLVNALALQIVDEMRVPASETITAAHVDQARERLILARATHLDSLLARLREDRVRRVLEPLLAGELAQNPEFDADFEYVVDLGLVAPGMPVRLANPIYREIILRVLASPAEQAVLVDPRSYVGKDGRLDEAKILREFADFWREQGELLSGGVAYPEVAPQLVLMAYLQRVVNGGGRVDREVGVGRKRIDLLIRWPVAAADGTRVEQRVALELKVWRDHDKKADPLIKGLAQLDEYLTRCGLPSGTLVIFDCRSTATPIDERVHFTSGTTPSGREVTVLRA